MTLDETVDRFINKAQSKIGRLGNELAFKKMNDDDCYQDQLFLIEELSAAIGLMQCCCTETSSTTLNLLDIDGTTELDVNGSIEQEFVSVSATNPCDILTDNEKYQIMSYLIDKADLDSLPLFPYGSICVSNKIVPGVGYYTPITPYHNTLLGLQGGLNPDYYHLSPAEYAALLGLIATPAPSGGASFTNITYANLIIAIAANALVKGGWYRITDYVTVHDILTSSPNVVNTGTAEPLIVLAIDVNKIGEQAFSELYPQDKISYTADNTFIAGATKGCILFRHDLQKNISCYYDWRNVKFRDYGALWQSTNLTIGTGNGVLTINATGGVDLYTFTNSQNPLSCHNIHIGLLSPNNRLNNIIFAQSASFYSTLFYKNVTIDSGCSEIRIGKNAINHDNVNVDGLSIGKSNSKIILDYTQLYLKGSIGASNTLMFIGVGSSNDSFTIGNKNTNIYVRIANKSLIIGNSNSNIKLTGFSSFATFENNVSNIYTRNNQNLDNVIFSSSVSDIELSFVSSGNFTNVVFGHGFKNKIYDFTNLTNTKFLISDNTAKTYSTAKSNVIFNMFDGAGDIWANEITAGGVVTTYKQV